MERAAVVVLGPPGCGKTTLTDRLGALADVRTVVMGRLLRKEASKYDKRAQKVREYVERGDLVPVETVTNVLIRELPHVEEGTLVFDGYPRSTAELDYFERIVANLGFRFACAIALEVPDDVADARLEGRHREDDRGPTVEERREVYKRDTVPLIKELEKRYGEHLHHVSSEPPADEVLRTVLEVLRDEEALGEQALKSSREGA
jgi:adenylate kinase